MKKAPLAFVVTCSKCGKIYGKTFGISEAKTAENWSKIPCSATSGDAPCKGKMEIELAPDEPVAPAEDDDAEELDGGAL